MLAGRTNGTAVRAVGCFVTNRASGGQRPTWPAIQWDMTRDQMPAWVLEVSGIARGADGRIKDGDVTLGVYRATGPVTQPEEAYRRAAAITAIDERRRTVARLRGLGATVVDAPPGRLAPELADTYLRLKATSAL